MKRSRTVLALGIMALTAYGCSGTSTAEDGGVTGTDGGTSSPDSAGGTGETGAPAKDAAGDSPSQAVDAAPSGAYTLTGVTVSPPTHPMGGDAAAGWEVTFESGLVTQKWHHTVGGNPGSMTMRFEWTTPPSQIRPGELWPITAKASLLINENPLGWDGSVDARALGGSLLPLKANGGSEVFIGSSNPAGYTISRAAIAKCPNGGADFDLLISAPNGNKDWSAEFFYHYKWNP